MNCTIEAITELGFQGTSVAEVARRAGVSKGVVTYHFAAKDDLILAVVAHVFDSISEHLESRLQAADARQFPEKFAAAYITAWVEYYRARSEYMLALREIWSSFRDESGRQHLGVGMSADELAMVERVLELGQARGRLGTFSARVMAMTIKGALDRLLSQFAADPELDLEMYGVELVTLFERATQPG